MPRAIPGRPWFLPLALALAPLGPGCGRDGETTPATPVVQPDSEAAKRALAESERMIRERQEQEAKARKRLRNLPDEG